VKQERRFEIRMVLVGLWKRWSPVNLLRPNRSKEAQGAFFLKQRRLRMSQDELKAMFFQAEITGWRMAAYLPAKYALRFPVAILLNPHIHL
jgi:hypothetical protein